MLNCIIILIFCLLYFHVTLFVDKSTVDLDLEVEPDLNFHVDLFVDFCLIDILLFSQCQSLSKNHWYQTVP